MNYHMHNYPASTVPHTAPVNMFDCHVVIGQHKIWETIVMIWKARKKNHHIADQEHFYEKPSVLSLVNKDTSSYTQQPYIVC